MIYWFSIIKLVFPVFAA